MHGRFMMLGLVEGHSQALWGHGVICVMPMDSSDISNGVVEDSANGDTHGILAETAGTAERKLTVR